MRQHFFDRAILIGIIVAMFGGSLIGGIVPGGWGLVLSFFFGVAVFFFLVLPLRRHFEEQDSTPPRPDWRDRSF
jgi:hypothetical protein